MYIYICIYIQNIIIYASNFCILFFIISTAYGNGEAIDKSPRSACWWLAKMAPCFQAKWRFCWVSNGRWKSYSIHDIFSGLSIVEIKSYKIYSNNVSIIYLLLIYSYSDYSVKFWHLFALSDRVFFPNFSWSSAPPESPKSFHDFNDRFVAPFWYHGTCWRFSIVGQMLFQISWGV